MDNLDHLSDRVQLDGLAGLVFELGLQSHEPDEIRLS